MVIAHSRNGVPLTLTRSRWAHIVERHPELRLQRSRVIETIAEPDVVQQGDYGALLAARYYNQPGAVNLFVVVVYREVDETRGFVITAYVARRLSGQREVLWSR
jgi:hypothetical protein